MTHGRLTQAPEEAMLKKDKFRTQVMHKKSRARKQSVTRSHQMPNARGFLEDVAAAYPSISRPLLDADPLRLLPFEVSVERIRIVHRPNAIEVSERLDEVNTMKTNGICAHQVLESVNPDFKSNVKSHIAVTLTRSQKRNARTNQHHRRKTQEDIAAKKEIEAGILKKDIKTTKRFRSDLDGNLGQVKKARSRSNATGNDDLNTGR